MIINITSVKSEALLLFCRDLIDSYVNNEENIFEIDENLNIFIQKHIDDLQNGVKAILQPNEYYIRNMNVSRIKMIIKYYNFINREVSKFLEIDGRFNPSMLCFSMLATWFKELDKETHSKEYIFFSIYPYGEIYDSLLINIKNNEYKKLNIFMIQIAENIMMKLDKK